MTIEEFYNIIIEHKISMKDYDKYLVGMSCSTYEYTLKNPNESFEHGKFDLCDGFEFEIDWNHKITYTLQEMINDIVNGFLTYKLRDTDELISWDVDDGNIIHFKDVVITEDKIILV